MACKSKRAKCLDDADGDICWDRCLLLPRWIFESGIFDFTWDLDDRRSVMNNLNNMQGFMHADAIVVMRLENKDSHS
jgi:hypothetical protein